MGRLGRLGLGLVLIASRLQLQGELQAKNEGVKKYRGVLHGVKVILQNEGPRGLFRGIGSAVSETIPL
jgi:solute carrier family 25 protein 34/35